MVISAVKNIEGHIDMEVNRKPKANKMEIANTLANAYSALQMKGIKEAQEGQNKNLMQLNDTTSNLLRINQSMLHSQRNLEATITEQVEINSRNLEVQEKMYELQVLDRQERAEREEIKDFKEDEVRNLKSFTHTISRERQIISSGSMSNLEKFFSLEKLQPLILLVDNEQFPDTPDKIYRDQTEDSIRDNIKDLQDQFSEQDRADLKKVFAIEEFDENAEASALLKDLDSALDVRTAISRLRLTFKSTPEISLGDSSGQSSADIEMLRNFKGKKMISDKESNNFIDTINEVRKAAGLSATTPYADTKKSNADTSGNRVNQVQDQLEGDGITSLPAIETSTEVKEKTTSDEIVKVLKQVFSRDSDLAEKYEPVSDPCCPCCTADVIEAMGLEIDWDIDDGVPSVIALVSPALDDVLKEYLSFTCDDDEHNEWNEKLRNGLSI